jgi:single-stranded-DNA-specific exonuclease
MEPRWALHPGHAPERALALARELGAPAVVGQLLLNRGVRDAAAAEGFLAPSLDRLHDPLRLLGMEAAVARIRRARERGERVLVHGDFDADGLTAATVAAAALRALGLEARASVPHRARDGYGLSVAAIEAEAARGTTLVVTVDCGITAVEAVARGRALGVDVVVTDHHRPGPELPGAAAVVNPHQPGCAYPFKGLCGAGVAFKLAQALLGGGAERFLDVVALGTIADAVPLLDENRVLAHAGLDRLARTERPGLIELAEVSGLERGRVTAGQVAFLLAPRLNAAGRLDSAERALRLLMTEDRDEARALARSLDEDNSRRRKLDQEVEREAVARVESEGLWPESAAIVLGAEGWHPGVLGIVASRLVERFQRPAVLIAEQGEWARGSARSLPGFDLAAALAACHDLLEAYGGHARAAGLTLARARLPEFRRRFETLARRALDLEACFPVLAIDADLPLAACDLELLSWLDRLPPHGAENAEPTFRAEDVRVQAVSRLGDGDHLRLELSDASGAVEAVAFGLGERLLEIFRARRCAIAYVPQRNEWMGETRVQIKVKGVRLP